MSTGRKERYTPEAYAAVIKDLADGIPLANALGGPNRPGRTALYERLKTDPEWRGTMKAPCNRGPNRKSMLSST